MKIYTSEANFEDSAKIGVFQININSNIGTNRSTIDPFLKESSTEKWIINYEISFEGFQSTKAILRSINTYKSRYDGSYDRRAKYSENLYKSLN
jgi:hypothetical protein